MTAPSGQSMPARPSRGSYGIYNSESAFSHSEPGPYWLIPVQRAGDLENLLSPLPTPSVGRLDRDVPRGEPCEPWLPPFEIFVKIFEESLDAKDTLAVDEDNFRRLKKFHVDKR